MQRLAMAVLAFAVLASARLSPASAEAFYAGKKLTLLINFAAGGPSDVEGRVIANYLARHIEGQPTVIVQNREGAGGLVGTTYLGELAPRDGTMLGWLAAAGWQYVVDTTPRRSDFKSYEFVAYLPGTPVYYMRRDVKPGINTPADLMSAENIIVGGLSADSPKDLLLRLTLDMLGVKYKYVTGYRSSNNARLAMQQREINLYSETAPAYRAVVEPSLVAKGEAIGLFYDAPYDGVSFSPSKQVEGLPVKPFQDFYKQMKGGEPSGPLWDAYRTAAALNNTMLRIVAFPPGSPKAAVEAIRTAILRIMDDKDFAADATRTFGFVPEIMATPQTPERIRTALNVSPGMRTWVNDYIKAGQEKK